MNASLEQRLRDAEKRLDIMREDVNTLMRGAALLITKVEALEALAEIPPDDPGPPSPPAAPARRGRVTRLPSRG